MYFAYTVDSVRKRGLKCDRLKENDGFEVSVYYTGRENVKKKEQKSY